MSRAISIPKATTALPASPREKNGVVYTRPWVVDLILDLSRYTPDEDLQPLLIVEPAAGDGSFVLAIVQRLLDSCRHFDRPVENARDSLLAYELDPESSSACRSAVTTLLVDNGVSSEVASTLAESWIRTGDYLLDRHALPLADVVVGNPPYIRFEDIAADRAKTYRRLYPTMVGRADLYIAFFEAALRQLKPGGVCAYICADRWMLNQYGAQLRQLITSRYAVETVIEVHKADVFHSEVSAYPAITVIRDAPQQAATVARVNGTASFLGAERIQNVLRAATNEDGVKTARIDGWFRGVEPWPCYNPERLALLKRLEAEFYPLDSPGTGTRSGIGVASGADRIYLTRDPDLIEPERLLPMAMARDIASGHLTWSGNYLVNPWEGNGLAHLSRYPRLRQYLEDHEDELRARHVGKKTPHLWYRTIDRVEAGLIGKPKLYIADIKERLNPVLDRGETYPHHNLYFIQSAGWDHEVLGGLLLSDVAQFFIECYGVRMRGYYLRFQAQYLRRIRLPRPSDVFPAQAEMLTRAFRERDRPLATEIALQLYGIDQIPADDY